MKKNLISGIAGSLTVLMLSSCVGLMNPEPVEDPNAKPLNEPVSYYGDIEMFDEKTAPLMVKITSPVSSDDASLPEVMKNILQSSDVNCVHPGIPCDISISVNSAYHELTSAPSCRMRHLLSINVAAADGTVLLKKWEHKTETAHAYPSAADAKSKMKGMIHEAIREWEKNNFRNEAGKLFKVSIVRFRTSRSLIEFNSVRFEQDLRKILNRLRQIKGVVDVRMIEIDKANRIASFRVLYRNDVFLKNMIRKQLKNK